MKTVIWRFIKLFINGVFFYFVRERVGGGRRLDELASELHTTLKAQPWWKRSKI